MTGLCAVRVEMLESKRTVHLDLARSNADVFLLASGRSGCRAPIERVDVEHAKAAKDRAPAHLRGAIGCHRSVHAVGARKLSCRRFSSKLRLDRCDCSRSFFTQVMPHTQLPYRRVRAMNGAAHRERCAGWAERASAPQSGHPSFSHFYGIATPITLYRWPLP